MGEDRRKRVMDALALRIPDRVPFMYNVIHHSIREKLLGQKNEYLDTETGREFLENFIEKFREHRLVAIEATAGREAMEKSRKYAADHGINDEDARMRVTGMLGKMACKIIEKVNIDILAVFGGDTLMEIIKSMRAAGVRPLHEIEPGTVISDLIGGKYPIQIVSKSGGLGTEDIVRNIVYYFNE